MTLKIGHIFENQVFRLMVFQYSQDFIKQSAVSRMLKTVLRPSLGEGLAREPCTQHIVGGNVGYRHSADITGSGHSEIQAIELAQAYVNF